MSLQVWLPLNGNLNNLGLTGINFNSYTGGSFSVNNNGKIGKCYLGYIVKHLTEEFLGNTWSIALWVNSTSAWGATNDIILCKNIDNSDSCQFYMSIINGATFNIGVNAGNNSASVSYTFSTNTWYHLAVSYNGSKINMYINGNLVKTANHTSSQLTGKLNLGIGCRSTNSAGTSVTGMSKLFNDVRIYDHCLTPQEVKELSKGLALHYTLDSNCLKQNSNLITTPSISIWNNSGTSTSNSNDTSYSNVPVSGKVMSITKGESGNSGIYLLNNVSILAHHSYYCGCWVYYTGSDTYSDMYMRTGDTKLSSLSYNGNANSTQWPRNKWIYVSTIISDPASNYSDVRFCDYVNTAGSKKAYIGWFVKELNGTIYDSSGYCNNATINNYLRVSTDSPRYDSCIYTAGLTTYADATVSTIGPNQSIYTISWWAKSSVALTNKMMWGLGALNFYGMYWNTGDGSNDPFYTISNGSPTTTTITAPSITNWTHFAIVGNGSTVKLYVNGVWYGQAKTFKAIPTNTLRLNGRQVDGSGNQYGINPLYLSDFRIYSTALSTDDIKDLYNMGASVS